MDSAFKAGCLSYSAFSLLLIFLSCLLSPVFQYFCSLKIDETETVFTSFFVTFSIVTFQILLCKFDAVYICCQVLGKCNKIILLAAHRTGLMTESCWVLSSFFKGLNGWYLHFVRDISFRGANHLVKWIQWVTFDPVLLMTELPVTSRHWSGSTPSSFPVGYHCSCHLARVHPVPWTGPGHLARVPTTARPPAFTFLRNTGGNHPNPMKGRLHY